MDQRISGKVGKTVLASIGIAAAVLGGLPGPSGGAHAATILSQGPCTNPPDDFCVSFGASGAIPDIRSRTLHATGPGKAVVTFHGSLTCANFTSIKGGVQLTSQIVDKPGATPVATRPGGLTHLATLPPDGRATFNLASTRVFTIAAAGTYTYIFKIERVDLSPAASECRVYNAAFTIAFEPATP